MTFTVSLILYICIVPTAILIYFLGYPKNWQKKKRVLGVNNRKEFLNPKAEEFIDIINNTHRKQALIITVSITVIATVLLFFRSMFVITFVWTIFVYVALILLCIPYALGNSELKKYKRSLGIIDEKIMYADLKNAGAVHALNKPILIFGELVGLAIIILSLLIDTGVLPVSIGFFEGTYALTILSASFISVNFILLPLAIAIDNTRNEVISSDSNINANYNRAKKKLSSDFVLSLTWLDNIFTLCAGISLILVKAEIMMMILIGLYMVVIMIVMAVMVYKKIKLEEVYVPKNTSIVEEDDDYWYLGMFYFNPGDKRLNVDKRFGVGYTINMAHPVGMVISALGILAIIFSILVLVWIALMGCMPIKTYEDNGVIICHHLWDEYKITESEIKEISLGELKDLNMYRTSGTAMDNVVKGTFKVDDEKGCKVFLNPEAGEYIKIVTDEKTYYISASTNEETEVLYGAINAQ